MLLTLVSIAFSIFFSHPFSASDSLNTLKESSATRLPTGPNLPPSCDCVSFVPVKGARIIQIFCFGRKAFFEIILNNPSGGEGT